MEHRARGRSGPPEVNTIPTPAQTMQQALTLHRQGRLAEAERLYRAALAKQPRQFEVLHFLGVLRLQQGDAREAFELLRAATKAKPNAAEVQPSLGAALAALGRHEEALAVYDAILRAKPDDTDAGYNRGVVFSHLGRHAEALASYDKVLASRPGHVAALFNRGNVLAMFQRFDEALASYDSALALAPRHIDALANRADALKALRRHDEALAAYDRVLRIVPQHADALNNRGNALFELRRYDEAIASLNAALAVKPNDPDMLFNLGRALQEVDRDEAALVAFGEALAARPENADAWYSRGNSSLKLERTSDAIADYERALALAPDHPHAFDVLLRVRLDACDWQDVARLTEEVPWRVAGASSTIHPLKLLCLPVTPAIQLRCAQSWVAEKTRGLQTPSNFEAHHRDRLRIAYLSADFRVHAVAMLIAELFELHDRSRFEVLAISFGPEDGSQMRSRIVQSVDQFHDVSARDDLESAKLIKDLEVDIAVDLMGHTRHARIGILGATRVMLGSEFSRPVRRRFRRAISATREQPEPTSSTTSSPTRSCCHSRTSRSIPNGSFTCRTATKSTTGAVRSPRKCRPVGKQDCPNRRSCSAASTTVSKSPPRFSRSGCGCCARWTLASCGCWSATQSQAAISAAKPRLAASIPSG